MFPPTLDPDSPIDYANVDSVAGNVADLYPDLDTSTVALLGLSNAGYLAYKAAPAGGQAKPVSANEQPPAQDQAKSGT